MTQSHEARLAVIIVNYGTSALVLKALPALLRDLDGLGPSAVFIVDNASPGDDGAALAEGLRAFPEAAGAAPQVRFLPSAVNGGFAAGNNVGFAEIRRLGLRPEAVLLLNPDAEVRPGALAEMLRVLESDPAIGFVGPRVENPDGSSWVGAFNFPSMGGEVFGALGLDVLARHFRSTIPDSDRPVRADWITGTAMMIRGQAFAELGDMDDGYFLYYEEVDYMLQGARLGWQSWHAPQARVHHIAGAATGVVDKTVARGRMPAYWFQAWARYFAKNHGPAHARTTALLRILATLLGDLQRSLRGRQVPRPQRFLRDFAAATLFSRLSPPPVAPTARNPANRPVTPRPGK